MKLVVIESPWRGLANRESYLLDAIRYSVDLGHSPYASHRVLIGALDDDRFDHRQLGLALGLTMTGALLDLGAEHWFFTDFGMSQGMTDALNYRASRVSLGKVDVAACFIKLYSTTTTC